MTKFVFPIAPNSLKLTAGSAADDSNDIKRAEGGGRRGGGLFICFFLFVCFAFVFAFFFVLCYALNTVFFFFKKGASFLSFHNLLAAS